MGIPLEWEYLGWFHGKFGMEMKWELRKWEEWELKKSFPLTSSPQFVKFSHQCSTRGVQ